LGKRLSDGDTKFAVKAHTATATLPAPALFDHNNPFFVKYYEDWTLISVCLSS
ncbi:uncharacterized protein C8R40DRAFT_1043470, partial [Lentinula edodes]|uniref:uncharacterized protein n=1 Tax=Lentinula edodes TaxID=5353 RepID=UPI001E8EEC1F